MIKEITHKQLLELGIDPKDKHSQFYFTSNNSIYVDRQNDLIYTGKDALRIYHFSDIERPTFPMEDLDLVPEYFCLSLKNEILREKEIAKSLFNSNSTVNRFIKLEMERVQNEVEKLTSFDGQLGKFLTNKDSISKFNYYNDWLNNVLEEIINIQDKLSFIDEKYSKLSESEEQKSQYEPELLGKIKARFEECEATEGWKALFRNKRDFENLSMAIFQHFSKLPVTMPSEIKLLKRKKTKVASLLGALHKQYSDFPKFKDDETFFDIVRTIEGFQNEKDLAKTLKR